MPARRLQESLDALGATGKAGEVVRLPGAGITAAPFVLAIGLGKGGSGDRTEDLRRAAGTAARALAGTRRALRAPDRRPGRARGRRGGHRAGRYSFTAFPRLDERAPRGPRSAAILVPDAKDADAKAAVARAVIVAGAVARPRPDQHPAVGLAPADLRRAAAVDAAGGLPLEVEVLDEKALQDGGYGGILGVGQGSAPPPRLVRLAYRPEGAKTHLALVGKGITFDSGGISHQARRRTSTR